jgi:hypothetical protein
MIARSPALRGELEVVLPGYRMVGGALHAVLPSHAFVPARVALLRDFLIEKLGGNLARAERECTAHKESESKKRTGSR